MISPIEGLTTDGYGLQFGVSVPGGLLRELPMIYLLMTFPLHSGHFFFLLLPLLSTAKSSERTRAW